MPVRATPNTELIPRNHCTAVLFQVCIDRLVDAEEDRRRVGAAGRAVQAQRRPGVGDAAVEPRVKSDGEFGQPGLPYW